MDLYDSKNLRDGMDLRSQTSFMNRALIAHESSFDCDFWLGEQFRCVVAWLRIQPRRGAR